MPTRRFENLEPERKAAILDAAQSEFTLSGYEGASLNKIIADAGISKGSFYYYFEDKADLYITTLERVIMKFTEHAGGGYKGEFSDDFWSDIEDMMRQGYTAIREAPELMQFFRGVMHLSTHVLHHPALQLQIDRLNEMFAGIVQRGQEMGVLRTDVPLGLLVNVVSAAGEGIDRWTFETYETLSDADIEWLVGFAMDIMKKIAGSESTLHPREEI